MLKIESNLKMALQAQNNNKTINSTLHRKTKFNAFCFPLKIYKVIVKYAIKLNCLYYNSQTYVIKYEIDTIGI